MEKAVQNMIIRVENYVDNVHNSPKSALCIKITAEILLFSTKRGGRGAMGQIRLTNTIFGVIINYNC